MTDKPIILIYKQDTFTVGQDTFIDSVADNQNAVVFEGNGETGYFYAIDNSEGEIKILDALHIYNVNNVVDKEKPSTIKILWTVDETKSFLSINNYYHAVFDFKNKAGYCRNAFPDASGAWTKEKNRELTDHLIEDICKT